MLRPYGDCMTVDFSCPLVADTLGLTTEQVQERMKAEPKAASPGPSKGPISLFVSVFRAFAVENNGASLVEDFVRNFCSIHAAPNSNSELSENCNFDLDCLSSKVECAPGATSRACIRGKCVCSAALFHDAVSPALKYDSSAGTFVVDSSESANDPLYTEPRWAKSNLSHFLQFRSWCPYWSDSPKRLASHCRISLTIRTPAKAAAGIKAQAQLSGNLPQTNDQLSIIFLLRLLMCQQKKIDYSLCSESTVLVDVALLV